MSTLDAVPMRHHTGQLAGNVGHHSAISCTQSRSLAKGTAALNGDGHPQVNEARVREDLVAAHRLTRMFGMDDLVWNHISARRPPPTAPRTPSGGAADDYLITPFPYMYDEITADNLDSGSGNETGMVIHGAIYPARPDVNAIVHTHTPAIMAVAALQDGLVLLSQDAAAFYGMVRYHSWEGLSTDYEEQAAIATNLGPAPAHTLIMRNHGAVTVGRTVGQAWVRMYYLDRVCRVQLDAMKTGSPLCLPSDDAMRHAAAQYLLPEYEHGTTEWEALKRLARRGGMHKESLS